MFKKKTAPDGNYILRIINDVQTEDTAFVVYKVCFAVSLSERDLEYQSLRLCHFFATHRLKCRRNIFWPKLIPLLIINQLDPPFLVSFSFEWSGTFYRWNSRIKVNKNYRGIGQMQMFFQSFFWKKIHRNISSRLFIT